MDKASLSSQLDFMNRAINLDLFMNIFYHLKGVFHHEYRLEAGLYRNSFSIGQLFLLHIFKSSKLYFVPKNNILLTVKIP